MHPYIEGHLAEKERARGEAGIEMEDSTLAADHSACLYAACCNGRDLIDPAFRNPHHCGNA